MGATLPRQESSVVDRLAFLLRQDNALEGAIYCPVATGMVWWSGLFPAEAGIHFGGSDLLSCGSKNALHMSDLLSCRGRKALQMNDLLSC